jgi:hypothetical protein
MGACVTAVEMRMKQKIGLSHRRIAVTAGLLALASCAQLPPHVSIPHKTDVANTSATFAQCAMSVRFTGPPRALSPQETAALGVQLTKFYKWEVDGLGYEQYRLMETAFCVCRDAAFSSSDIAQAESALRSNKDYKFLGAYDLAYSRRAFEFESSASSNGITDRMQFAFPTVAPRCMFVQAIRFDSSTSSAAGVFFGTAQPATPASRSPSGSAANRLEELGDLRRRGLITEDEYQQRRRAILQGL